MPSCNCLLLARQSKRVRTNADASTSGTQQINDDATDAARRRGNRGYRTGRGSMYFMLFGYDRQQQGVVLDLNEE